MDAAKRKFLEKAGYRVTTAAEFLELTEVEQAMVETKLALAAQIKAKRQSMHLTQTALAKRMDSNQSRVAKIEAADPTVSLDLMARALFALGTKPKQFAKAFA